MNFKETLAAKTAETEKIIERYLPEEKGQTAKLAAAINYSMRAPGKRLRPLMLLESYQMFGGKERVAEPFATAMEMIHTHSLIHDDLPALDNDDIRRGKKTTWAVYGEAMGVLSGDALLNYAYEVAFSAFDFDRSREEVALALQVLACKTGIFGMLGGQSVDVAMDGQSVDEETLYFIYKKKTSALLEASLMLGPLLAGASSKKVHLMEQVGSYVGLAFQIRDDILDVTGTAESIGKPIHSDERNHKTTYVSLKGLSEAKREAERLSQEAVEIFDSMEEKNPFLRQLLLQLAKRQK